MLLRHKSRRSQAGDDERKRQGRSASKQHDSFFLSFFYYYFVGVVPGDLNNEFAIFVKKVQKAKSRVVDVESEKAKQNGNDRSVKGFPKFVLPPSRVRMARVGHQSIVGRMFGISKLQDLWICRK